MPRFCAPLLYWLCCPWALPWAAVTSHAVRLAQRIVRDHQSQQVPSSARNPDRLFSTPMTSPADKRSLLTPPDTAARAQLTADADNAALRAVSTQDTASSEDNDDPAFDSLLRAVAAAPSVGSPPTLPQPGDLLGEVEIIKEIGQGGMGRVYLARDLALGRLVAVKMLLARGDAEERAVLAGRFRIEAQATARLDHPNIVTVHTFGDWRGAPFLVMERLRGESLADRLDDAAQSRLPLDEAVAIAVQLLEGLDHAPTRGHSSPDPELRRLEAQV